MKVLTLDISDPLRQRKFMLHCGALTASHLQHEKTMSYYHDLGTVRMPIDSYVVVGMSPVSSSWVAHSLTVDQAELEIKDGKPGLICANVERSSELLLFISYRAMKGLVWEFNGGKEKFRYQATYPKPTWFESAFFQRWSQRQRDLNKYPPAGVIVTLAEGESIHLKASWSLGIGWLKMPYSWESTLSWNGGELQGIPSLFK